MGDAEYLPYNWSKVKYHSRYTLWLGFLVRLLSRSPKLTKGAEVKLWGVEGVTWELVEVHILWV